jgi:hypothetical protein
MAVRMAEHSAPREDLSVAEGAAVDADPRVAGGAAETSFTVLSHLSQLRGVSALIGAFFLVVRAHAAVISYKILPSDVNPSITRFNEPNVVLSSESLSTRAKLVVFLPGGGGAPSNALPLLTVVAAQGYAVIGLEYNNTPSVVQVCPSEPNPLCSSEIRQERIFGGKNKSLVENTSAETIVNRLTELLEYLGRHDGRGPWLNYVAGGRLNWSRIVISGFSQGAGMAAYIAKRKVVARVVLFSSPWDFQRPSQQLASWISAPSATPARRWYALYHRREDSAELIARAYVALAIPASHIRILDLDLSPDLKRTGDNPFHRSTVRMTAYSEDWAFLYGKPP